MFCYEIEIEISPYITSLYLKERKKTTIANAIIFFAIKIEPLPTQSQHIIEKNRRLTFVYVQTANKNNCYGYQRTPFGLKKITKQNDLLGAIKKKV